MTKINADAIQRVKKAAREKTRKDFTDNEVEQGIVAYFDPTIPPPDFTPEEIENIVRSLLGEEPK